MRIVLLQQTCGSMLIYPVLTGNPVLISPLKRVLALWETGHSISNFLLSLLYLDTYPTSPLPRLMREVGR